MSFSRDKGSDGLWRQGVDLIGDKRRRQVGEGIENGAMFGQPEGGEFLDVTDDGFDDVAPVKQSLVEERNRLPIRSWVSCGAGVVSLTLPGVRASATIWRS